MSDSALNSKMLPVKRFLADVITNILSFSMKTTPEFPIQVKAIREQLGLSQEALAWKIGISFATLNRWENGKSNPSKLAQSQLEKFCARMIRKGDLVENPFA